MYRPLGYYLGSDIPKTSAGRHVARMVKPINAYIILSEKPPGRKMRMRGKYKINLGEMGCEKGR